MPFPFDATLKEIVQAHAADFAPVFGLPADQPATALDVDLSTVSAATDVALGYGEPPREIADLNFQSGADPHADWRLHFYNAALGHHFHVPVRSLLLLLRPAADHANLTGVLRYGAGAGRVEFGYEVVRLWQQPAGPFLTGGVGLLPLAPLCALPAAVPLEAALADVVREIDRRLIAETSPAEAAVLMTAAFVLTGLRVPRESLAEIYRGVGVMHDSSAYQLILDEGKAAGRQEGLQEGQIAQSKRLLLRQGRIRYGAPDAATEAALMALRDIARLDRMAEAILVAANWQELLATP